MRSFLQWGSFEESALEYRAFQKEHTPMQVLWQRLESSQETHA